MFDLVKHLFRQREFSLATFGPGKRRKGVSDHIRKELDEIEADPDGKGECEWIDVIILAFDGALRDGREPEEIVRLMVAKQAKNEGRTWPDWRNFGHDQAIEHDRSGEMLMPLDTPPPSSQTIPTGIVSICPECDIAACKHLRTPPQNNGDQWKPWFDMPVGDHRGVVREVRSENGETALAYWTGKIMALAPVSDDPVELPFKVWGQRPPSQPITVTAPEPHMAGDLDDKTIARLARENFSEKDYDRLTYEKSPPMFPQATYDVPTYALQQFVKAVRAATATEDGR